MELFGVSPTQLLLTTIVAYGVYLTGLVIYRLFFHPLAKFPGPKYAAISRWHEFYHEVVRNGQFSFVIEEWHKQYGPIIRIVPDEIHIQDSQFYDTVYTKAGRVDKYDFMAPRFNSDMAAFATASADLHALRRGPLNPLFSRTRIAQLEGLIRDKVDILVKHIRNYQKNGQPFVISRGFMALAGDVIMRYCFDMDYDHLNSKDFEVNFHEAFMAASIRSPLSIQFPLVPRFFNSLPESWVEKSEPLFALLFKIRRDLLHEIINFKSKERETSKKQFTTVFQAILDDPDLPQEQKENARLNDEAQLIVGAAITTTGWSLSVGAFNIIGNPKIYQRLRKELEDAIPDPNQFPRWSELEKLPYLSGCVRESIRLSYPVTARNPRLLPRPITYQNWVIPARTPVSMTITDVNNDEDVFPDHSSFKPERWIDPPLTEDGSSLDRYFVCFQKGTRSCLGVNLAYCEIFLVMATIYRNFKFELYETDQTDVKIVHDFFIPSPRLDSKGIRVRCLPN